MRGRGRQRSPIQLHTPMAHGGSSLPAFERGHCYEPYIQNGNFTTSDPTYNLGTMVEFTCDPGHSLEQGPAVIECINMRDPYWNDTEPLCRGQCQHRRVMLAAGTSIPWTLLSPACLSLMQPRAGGS